MKMTPGKMALSLVGVAIVMVGFSFAAVPFYSWFCRVTGFGGETGVATAGSDEILDRTMTIRFDASLDRDMPWTFRPAQREMEVRIGETALAFFEASNPTDRPVAGQAAYNVTPYEAGGYFDKIECFCFTEQVLQPGETVMMPVSFFVDPEITRDRDASGTTTITLGYTFYEIDLPEEYASLAPQAQPGALTAPLEGAIDTY
ncbi:cytochrome c oxidase assembly protein [Pseudoroseicyclus sp. CXY001]|uniref:cytochrome c oxidase assembly protein n=1 Tax=Pseudoroseicyclus sp. CXY001 TaxID=3242492 RepID=UPI003570A78B